MKFLDAFLRPAVTNAGAVLALPQGMQGVDPKGGAGFAYALAQNVNANALDGMQSYATTTAVTFVVQDILNGIVQLNTGAGAGYTATLPTTAQILAALGPSVPQDGSFSRVFVIVNNNSGQTATLTAGDTPTSVVGTATIATNVTRLYVMRVLASSLVFTNIGSLTL